MDRLLQGGTEEMALAVPLMRPFLLSLSVLTGSAGVVPN